MNDELWASWDETTDELVHICPVCDERIKEPHLKGSNYDKHYQMFHTSKADK